MKKKLWTPADILRDIAIPGPILPHEYIDKLMAAMDCGRLSRLHVGSSVYQQLADGFAIAGKDRVTRGFAGALFGVDIYVDDWREPDLFEPAYAESL